MGQNRRNSSMTGMNNALLQLALMLQGNPALRNGLTNSWSSGPSNTDPWGSPTPMHPMMNSWAALPNPPHGIPGGHLPITPAQEFFFGTNPAYELPNYPAWEMPEYIPIPDILPHVKPLPPDVVPPFMPPTAIPHEDTDDDISEYGEKPKRMSKRCQKEWADADLKCQEKRAERYRAGDFSVFDMDKCKRGYVSEACGGNPVDWGPKGKPVPKPKPKPYNPLVA